MQKKIFTHLFLFFMFTSAMVSAENSGLPPRAIVVGASSGIGRALCHVLANHGYDIALVARREHLLLTLQAELAQTCPGTKTWVKTIDVTDEKAEDAFKNLLLETGPIDLVVISITSFPELASLPETAVEGRILNVELLGFWKIAHIALDHFIAKKSGHLVGISSVDALRGNPACPMYSAAKAFVSMYLEGVRNRLHQLGFSSISITDILPGYVQTEGFDALNTPGAYWIATAQDAASQIYDAIEQKKKQAFITKRWWIIGLLMKHLPDWLFYDVIGGL